MFGLHAVRSLQDGCCVVLDQTEAQRLAAMFARGAADGVGKGKWRAGNGAVLGYIDQARQLFRTQDFTVVDFAPTRSADVGNGGWGNVFNRNDERSAIQVTWRRDAQGVFLAIGANRNSSVGFDNQRGWPAGLPAIIWPMSKGIGGVAEFACIYVFFNDHVKTGMPQFH